MSTKITNNFKVHAENTTQKFTDAQYSSESQRIEGAQPGTAISSKLINTGLREATLFSAALIEALKSAIPDNADLTNPIVVGVDTTFDELSAMLAEALVKIKVNSAALADNVKSGAIVEETTRAREAKQGYPLSLSVNSKLKFHASWIGTYKNNDVVYYSTPGANKGYYVVKGLAEETAESPAGTITIGLNDTPLTHAAHLTRLTIEATIGSDTNLSKTDAISSASTTNQLATGKSVYDYSQPKIGAGTGTEILVKTATAGILGVLNKVLSINSGSTDDQLPTAKAVYNYAQPIISSGEGILTRSSSPGQLGTLLKTSIIDANSTDNQLPTAKAVVDYVEGRKWKLIRPESLGWTIVAGSNKNTIITIEVNTNLSMGDVVVLELDGVRYDSQNRVDRPFLVQIPLTHLPSSDPTNKGMFKAEYLSGYFLGINDDIYREAKFFVWFSYHGSNLYFKLLRADAGAQYSSQQAINVIYNKHSYDTDIKYPVNSSGLTEDLFVRRIWLVK